MISNKVKTFLLVCATLPPTTVIGTFAITSAQNFAFARANGVNGANTIVLDDSNAPVLSNGEGTMVDNKGVTWEYHNASNYNDGHIELNHQGYVGVSAGSAYGVTAITDLTVTFQAGSLGELWLLNSVDGVNWGEVEMLKKPTELDKTSATSTLIENWRYIRLYYYYNGNNPIDIDTLTVHYSCTGTSAQEDVDGAKDSNVIAAGVSANMTHAPEYENLSPNSNGGEAVSFTKTDTKSSTLGLGFGKTYTIGQILTSKVEFDMRTANINYGKSITLIKDAATVGSTIFSDSTLGATKYNSYKCTLIEGNWYHIEVAITCFITNISGYDGKDKPHTDTLGKEVNGIKINAGACIIDNLRISSTEGEAGNYNNLAQYPPKVNTVSWLKTSWVGVLYPELVEITFSDPEFGERIPLDDPKLTNGSPFYIRWLKTGEVTVTCTVVSGYNRQSHTVSRLFTVGSN